MVITEINSSGTKQCKGQMALKTMQSVFSLALKMHTKFYIQSWSGSWISLYYRALGIDR